MTFDSENEPSETDNSDEALEPYEDRWWERSSLSAARSQFREALAEGDASSPEITAAWLHYWVVANTRGLTRGASKALALLIENTIKRGGTLEDLTETDIEMRIAFSRFFARALIALAEQPRISLARLERLEHEICSYAARVGLGEPDAGAIRLALNAPLGRTPHSDDVRALREFWSQQKAETSSSDSDPSAAYCEAAMGQILVESLLLIGETEDALTVARQAVEESPCMSGCALAPQGLLSVCLEPLRQMGEESLAVSWEQKLASAAPPGHTWMAPAGARVRFLARNGSRDQALQLIQDTESFTREPQTSAWQRFLFFWGAADALTECDQKSDAEPFAEKALELALAFDQRNGNTTVSERLKVMTF